MRSCSSARVSRGERISMQRSGGGADDALGGPAKGQDANVGNAESGGGGLDALLGEGPDLPGFTVCEEDGGEGRLEWCCVAFLPSGAP